MYIQRFHQEVYRHHGLCIERQCGRGNRERVQFSHVDIQGDRETNHFCLCYNEKVEATRKRVNEEAQYWQDYLDNDHLRLLIQNDLADQMQKVYEGIIDEKKKVLG